VKTARGSIGERLRHERERRGIDLDTAAQATRIDRAFLEALEADAAPKAFPEPMYARAFLREYARYLGLKARPLVEAYRSAHPMKQQPPIGLPPIALDRSRSPWGRRALLLASIGAVAAIAVFSARAARGPDQELSEMPSVPPAAAPTSGATSTPPEKEEPPFRGVELRIKVVDGPCWVTVTRNGVDVLAETQEPGFARTFRSRSQIDVILGAPGVARVTLNGERVVLPDDGGVYQASFAFQGGRARVVASD
jgi:transcriptional regulator with XRE-family HTH domain